ncbi:MAG: rod shape-determining protein MreD [Clostridiaceae bacterium]
MKKFLWLVFIPFILIILDNSIMPFVSIKGIYPSLLLVFLICYAINTGIYEGIGMAIYCGFLQDLYLYSGIGICMFSNMIIAIAAYYIGKSIIKENIGLPSITVFLLSLLQGTLVFVFLFLTKNYFSFSRVFFNSIYDFVLALILYKFIYKFCNRSYIKAKWRF